MRVRVSEREREREKERGARSEGRSDPEKMAAVSDGREHRATRILHRETRIDRNSTLAAGAWTRSGLGHSNLGETNCAPLRVRCMCPGARSQSGNRAGTSICQPFKRKHCQRGCMCEKRLNFAALCAKAHARPLRGIHLPALQEEAKWTRSECCYLCADTCPPSLSERK
jgi:hypothetical protein